VGVCKCMEGKGRNFWGDGERLSLPIAAGVDMNLVFDVLLRPVAALRKLGAGLLVVGPRNEQFPFALRQVASGHQTCFGEQTLVVQFE
jgi:hypothetical protein